MCMGVSVRNTRPLTVVYKCIFIQSLVQLQANLLHYCWFVGERNKPARLWLRAEKTLGMWADPRQDYLCISVHQRRSHLCHMLKPEDRHLPGAYSSRLCLICTPSGQVTSTFTRELHGARHPLPPVSAVKIMPTSPLTLSTGLTYFTLPPTVSQGNHTDGPHRFPQRVDANTPDSLYSLRNPGNPCRNDFLNHRSEVHQVVTPSPIPCQPGRSPQLTVLQRA